VVVVRCSNSLRFAFSVSSMFRSLALCARNNVDAISVTFFSASILLLSFHCSLSRVMSSEYVLHAEIDFRNSCQHSCRELYVAFLFRFRCRFLSWIRDIFQCQQRISPFPQMKLVKWPGDPVWFTLIPSPSRMSASMLEPRLCSSLSSEVMSSPLRFFISSSIYFIMCLSTSNALVCFVNELRIRVVDFSPDLCVVMKQKKKKSQVLLCFTMAEGVFIEN